MALLARDRLIEADETGPAADGIDALTSDAAARAVRVPGATDAAALAPYLARLARIEIAFPAFRDGRGFTLARSLREHHDYRGELRATGGLIPDQHAFLLRCGFDSVELPAAHPDPAVWVAALADVTISYQRVPGEASSPLGALRRKLTEA